MHVPVHVATHTHMKQVLLLHTHMTKEKLNDAVFKVSWMQQTTPGVVVVFYICYFVERVAETEQGINWTSLNIRVTYDHLL